MALYNQRNFLKVVRLKQPDGSRLDVLAYTQFNVSANMWEIDICNKVTKDTVKTSLPPISAVERAGAIILLDQAVANANS